MAGTEETGQGRVHVRRRMEPVDRDRRDALRKRPVVRAVLDRCDEVLDGVRGASCWTLCSASPVRDESCGRAAAVPAVSPYARTWRWSGCAGPSSRRVRTGGSEGEAGRNCDESARADAGEWRVEPGGGTRRSPGNTYWRRQAGSGPGTFEACVESLAALGAYVVAVGPDAGPGRSVGRSGRTGTAATRRWPCPAMGRWRETCDRVNPRLRGGGRRAYEAGLPVSFERMIAGESRRRFALSGRPLECRRHRIKIRGRQAVTPI